MVKTDVVCLEKRNKVQRRATRIYARTRCALTGWPFFSKKMGPKRGDRTTTASKALLTQTNVKVWGVWAELKEHASGSHWSDWQTERNAAKFNRDLAGEDVYNPGAERSIDVEETYRSIDVEETYRHASAKGK